MQTTHALIVLALAALLALPATTATHLGNYTTNPVEHDDQGRSNEPDFRPGDCTVDITGDGRCTAQDLALWPPGRVVAQGCTQDSGRVYSGLCGIETVVCPGNPVGPMLPVCNAVGPPVTCTAPPSGVRSVRFLDTHVNVQLTGPAGGTQYVEVNRKLQDLGVFGAEQAALGGDGSDVIAGPTGVWAWYGVFRDRNCNGVIDHFGDGTTPDPRNEFTWIGGCLAFTGQPGVTGDVCRIEPTTLEVREFPGNHHAYAGLACQYGVTPVCGLTGADTPGSLVLCTALGGSAQDCDAWEAEFNGDPLFGPQGSTAVDFPLSDRTGDPDPATRMWVAGYGWAVFHYDQSLLVTTTMATAANGDQFVDVDRYTSRAPVLGELLQGTVKPTLRATWLTVRSLL